MRAYGGNKRGRALRIAVGITALFLMMAGGAGATKSINDNATGGDCTSIGTWNVASKTCTLTTDLTETIEIDSDGITLSGNGHTITGSSTGNGIYLSGRNGVTIKNTNVENFIYGIILYNSSNNTLSDNIANMNYYYGYYGIYMSFSSNNNITGNNGVISLFSSSNNNITGNNGGISLSSSSNNNITGNNPSNVYSSIILSSFSNNNTLIDNNGGISLSSSSNNNILGNNASNTYYAFGQSSSSKNNIMIDHPPPLPLIYYVGIYLLSSSSNNNITGNIASNNDYGIYILSSSNNNNITGNIANSNL